MRLLVWSWIALQIAGAQPQPPRPAASAEAHLKQAAAYRKQGDPAHAVAELRQALELQPELREAHAALGEILLAQGFAAEAVPHLEQGANVYAHAVGLIELNRFPEAVHELLGVCRERPNDPDVLFHLGEAAGALMQEAFNRLIRQHPDSRFARDLVAHKDPGQGLADLGKPEAADQLVVGYLLHPDDPEALAHLGQESGTLMQQAFGRLRQMHPASARAQELQARTQLGQGHGELAEPLFRSALRANPDLAGVHLALGRILLEVRGDMDGAEKEFRAEARLRPGSAEAGWRLGSVLLKKGQTKEALAELRESDRLKPDMLDTLLDLGKAYMMEGHLVDAGKAYGRIIEIDDTDELAAAAHLQLSQVYRRLGNAAEAEQHLKRFRELNAAREANPK